MHHSRSPWTSEQSEYEQVQRSWVRKLIFKVVELSERCTSKMATNLARLESVSYALFQKGYVPMIGEWVALPIWRVAGGKSVGDALYDEILHPTAGRLLQHCAAVLRLQGESKGADNDVRIALERGISVYHSLDEIPTCTT